MAQQRQHAVADEVDRRLVAGDQEQEGHRHGLVGGEAVGRPPTPPRSRRACPAPGAPACPRRGSPGTAPWRREPPDGLGSSRRSRRRAACWTTSGMPSGRLRHAEQLADHAHRQREGERVEQVDLLRSGGHVIGQPGGDLLDPRSHTGDGPCRECPGDQLAQPGVVRWIGAEHVPRQGVRELDRLVRAHRRPFEQRREARPVLGQPGVGERRPGVVVPRDQPHVHAEGGPRAGDRPFLPQDGVEPCADRRRRSRRARPPWCPCWSYPIIAVPGGGVSASRVPAAGCETLSGPGRGPSPRPAVEGLNRVTGVVWQPAAGRFGHRPSGSNTRSIRWRRDRPTPPGAAPAPLPDPGAAAGQPGHPTRRADPGDGLGAVGGRRGGAGRPARRWRGPGARCGCASGRRRTCTRSGSGSARSSARRRSDGHGRETAGPAPGEARPGGRRPARRGRERRDTTTTSALRTCRLQRRTSWPSRARGVRPTGRG